MLYDLSLHMGYSYDTPAHGARHIIRVLPLSIPGRQRFIAGTIDVSPVPEERAVFEDFFHQSATSVHLRAPHEKLDIRMQARVMVEAPALTADFSPELSRLPQDLADVWSVDFQSPHHFIGASPRLGTDTAISAYARELLKPGMTIREIALSMCKRIHKDFTYDGEATTVDTTPSEAFKLKRGVCQDFSHIMIMALRSLGIPAGYVSGFLRTIPRRARNVWKVPMRCMPGFAYGAVRPPVIWSSTPQTISLPAATISSLAMAGTIPMSRR